MLTEVSKPAELPSVWVDELQTFRPSPPPPLLGGLGCIPGRGGEHETRWSPMIWPGALFLNIMSYRLEPTLLLTEL